MIKKLQIINSGGLILFLLGLFSRDLALEQYSTLSSKISIGSIQILPYLEIIGINLFISTFILIPIYKYLKHKKFKKIITQLSINLCIIFVFISYNIFIFYKLERIINFEYVQENKRQEITERIKDKDTNNELRAHLSVFLASDTYIKKGQVTEVIIKNGTKKQFTPDETVKNIRHERIKLIKINTEISRNIKLYIVNIILSSMAGFLITKTRKTT